MKKVSLAALGFLGFLAMARAEDASEAKKTLHPRVGSPMPAMFHSIVVTGPRKDSDTCWV